MPIANFREHSLASVRLEIFFNDTQISSASGFFFRSENIFLVSNWHVFSGRDCFSGKCLSKNGAVPNNIQLTYFTFDGSHLHRKKQRISINRETEVVDWYQHSSGQEIDIGFIQMDDSIGDVKCANDRRIYIGNSIAHKDAPNYERRVTLKPATDLFVVGYPLGIGSHLGLPLWKRGTVASEAEIEINFASFLIDCNTNPGMSGSPVHIYTFGGVEDDNGNSPIVVGGYQEFVGIYSGRMLPNPALDDSEIGKLSLGRVFRTGTIMEALGCRVPASYVLGN